MICLSCFHCTATIARRPGKLGLFPPPPFGGYGMVAPLGDIVNLTRTVFSSIICVVLHILRDHNEGKSAPASSAAVSPPVPPGPAAHTRRVTTGRGMCVPSPGSAEAAAGLRLPATAGPAGGRGGNRPQGRPARLLSAGQPAGGAAVRGSHGASGTANPATSLPVSPLSE